MKLRINKLLASVIDFTIIMTLTVIFSRLLSSVLPPIRWIYCSLLLSFTTCYSIYFSRHNWTANNGNHHSIQKRN